MPGGLLNLIAEGNHNRVLTGNPTKTLFKTTYAKHTNFGLQKFRLDYSGQRTLSMDSTSKFTFKVPRHGDLLMDTYLAITLPTIWSPIVPPDKEPTTEATESWRPYEFQWIQHIGCHLIEQVRFTIGGQVIQEYSGDCLLNMVERDFEQAKKELFYRMIGHTEEMYNPAAAHETYPHAYYVEAPEGPEPSIRGRTLYVPLNSWFSLASEMAFPINSLEYNELRIEFELRPVRDLYTIRRIPTRESNGTDRKSPDLNNTQEQFYRFIHPPPSYYLNAVDYKDKRNIWNADIHLISTFAFLSEDENKVFQENTQTYLFRQYKRYRIPHIVGPNKPSIESNGMVSTWTWHFQRSDRGDRNEWSNYSNWAYRDKLPHALEGFTEYVSDHDGNMVLVTGAYKANNEKTIMKKCGLLFDGKARENLFDVGIYEYIEKYGRTTGNAPDGVYCYNFGLKNDSQQVQPSGAINTSKFKNVEFELMVLNPPLNPDAVVTTICDDNGNVVGIKKTTWDMYMYSYEMTIYEESYNLLTIDSGNASLLFHNI